LALAENTHVPVQWFMRGQERISESQVPLMNWKTPLADEEAFFAYGHRCDSLSAIATA
jgi:hypothetical protein